MARKYWLGLWLGAILLLFWGNSALIITDSVESNYALTAREMVQSGDWISPQIYGRYWFDKPVFFYWLTALAFSIWGCTEFAARFFPSLFGLLALFLAAWAGKKLYNERTGFFAALLLGSSLEFFLISKSVITDATLFFFFSLALVCYYLGYSTEQKRYYYGCYIGCALATLTKGPIGFLLPGLIIVLFLASTRSFSSLRQAKLLSGSLLFLAIALPWYCVMYSLHGQAFLDGFLGTHNFLRATVSEHPRDNVIYYYTLVNILAIFPWTAFLPQLLRSQFRPQGSWQLPSHTNLFCLLWAATIFIFFQCMATKYITYTYPLLFPFFLVLANYFDTQLNYRLNYTQLKLNPVLLFNFLINLLLATAAYWVNAHQIMPMQAPYLLIILGVGGLLLCIYCKLRSQSLALVAIAGCTLCFSLLLINNAAIPFSSQRSAKELGLSLQTKFTPNDSINCVGNYPTSAVFYSGLQINKLVPEEDKDSFIPTAYSWNSKNVMPYRIIEEIIAEKNTIVLVPNRNLADLGELRFRPNRYLYKVQDWNVLLF